MRHHQHQLEPFAVTCFRLLVTRKRACQHCRRRRTRVKWDRRDAVLHVWCMSCQSQRTSRLFLGAPSILYHTSCFLSLASRAPATCLLLSVRQLQNVLILTQCSLRLTPQREQAAAARLACVMVRSVGGWHIGNPSYSTRAVHGRRHGKKATGHCTMRRLSLA